jgi:hypothetical protein
MPDNNDLIETLGNLIDYAEELLELWEWKEHEAGVFGEDYRDLQEVINNAACSLDDLRGYIPDDQTSS